LKYTSESESSIAGNTGLFVASRTLCPSDQFIAGAATPPPDSRFPLTIAFLYQGGLDENDTAWVSTDFSDEEVSQGLDGNQELLHALERISDRFVYSARLQCLCFVTRICTAQAR
jgi:hypothetical protein